MPQCDAPDDPTTRWSGMWAWALGTAARSADRTTDLGTEGCTINDESKPSTMVTEPASGDGAAATGAPVAAIRTPRHFACFDGLRAIAAVSVLLLHTAWVLRIHARVRRSGVYTSRLEIGVSVFFLISGFLLYRPFAVSHLTGRAATQHPPVLGTPAAPHRAGLLAGPHRAGLRLPPSTMGPGWQGVVSHYLFLQIYFPTQIFFGITQAWSLCTEMTFYLFLPFYAVLVGVRRQSPAPPAGLGAGRRRGALRHQLRLAELGAQHAAAQGGGRQVRARLLPPLLDQRRLRHIMVDWLPAYLDLFGLGMLLAVLSAWFAERDSEPPLAPQSAHALGQLGLRRSDLLVVSHVVTDTNILYFVTPGGQPREAGAVRALRLLPPPAGGVRAPGPFARSAACCDRGRWPASGSSPTGSTSGTSTSSTASSTGWGGSTEDGAVLDPGAGRAGPVDPGRLGQLLRGRAAPPPGEGPDQLVGPGTAPPGGTAVRRTVRPTRRPRTVRPTRRSPRTVRRTRPSPPTGRHGRGARLGRRRHQRRRRRCPIGPGGSRVHAGRSAEGRQSDVHVDVAPLPDRLPADQPEADGAASSTTSSKVPWMSSLLHLLAATAVPQVVRRPAPGRWSAPPVRRDGRGPPCRPAGRAGPTAGTCSMTLTE